MGNGDQRWCFWTHEEKVPWTQESNELNSAMERKGIGKWLKRHTSEQDEPIWARDNLPPPTPQQEKANLNLMCRPSSLSSSSCWRSRPAFLFLDLPVWTDAIGTLPWLCSRFMAPNPALTDSFLLVNLCSRAFVSGPVLGALPLAPLRLTSAVTCSTVFNPCFFCSTAAGQSQSVPSQLWCFRLDPWDGR